MRQMYGTMHTAGQRGCLWVQEHLFLVCELLRANLYEFQKYNKENGDEPYFTLPHLQRIAQQVQQCQQLLITSMLKPSHLLGGVML